MESKELTVAAPGGAITGIVPHNLTEVTQLAKMIAKAGWAPKSYETNGKADEDKIAIGIMQGLEVGLKPVQALQSIAVVNGIPSLYGDGALAVLYSSGTVEDFIEEPLLGDWNNEKGVVIGYTCTYKRKGRPTPTVRTFTLEMARAAGLLDKTGPWKQYRARMLQMRARAWTMRDGAADVLKGMAIFEEVQDVEVTVVPTDRAAPPKSSTGKLDAFAGGKEAVKPEPAQDAEFVDKATGEVHAQMTPPDEVQKAFAEGKYSSWVNWFAASISALSEGATRQSFADLYMEALLKVRGASDRNQAVIDNVAATKGFSLKQPEAADGQ